MRIKDCFNRKFLKLVYVILVAVAFLVTLIMFEFGLVGYSDDAVGGRGTFDERFSYYDGDYFYETVDMMTEENKADYLDFHITDYFFVASYFCLMMIITVGVLPKKLKTWGYILPCLPAIGDLCENISIDLLIAELPARHTAIAGATGAFTCIKWYGGAVWLAFFAVAFVIWLIKTIKAKKL